jgi:hypothetical protein
LLKYENYAIVENPEIAKANPDDLLEKEFWNFPKN